MSRSDEIERQKERYKEFPEDAMYDVWMRRFIGGGNEVKFVHFQISGRDDAIRRAEMSTVRGHFHRVEAARTVVTTADKIIVWDTSSFWSVGKKFTISPHITIEERSDLVNYWTKGTLPESTVFAIGGYPELSKKFRIPKEVKYI